MVNAEKPYKSSARLPSADADADASDVMTTNMLAHDAEEGIDVFLEKREPKWTGE